MKLVAVLLVYLSYMFRVSADAGGSGKSHGHSPRAASQADQLTEHIADSFSCLRRRVLLSAPPIDF